ncbi:L,D-transpeptidase Cds6 family protein [Ramlibacter sp. AN1133]|uniref:L,D-transpeptidase Cds6 family protein n=1 Tax=Ramlibacter sp. AN1133 TaxID=3133429 RepID=UPI0030C04B37
MSNRPLRVLAIAVAGLASLAVDAAPRVLAIDSGTPGLQAPEQRRHEIEQALQAWKLAWELGEADTYLRFYDPDFRGRAPSRADWEKERRARLANRRISVEMEALRIRLLTQSEAEVHFVQRYMSASHQDAGAKRLRLKRGGGAWRITVESWAPQP